MNTYAFELNQKVNVTFDDPSIEEDAKTLFTVIHRECDEDGTQAFIVKSTVTNKDYEVYPTDMAEI